MTISKDLYLAILSMDAYNRGYGPGIALQGSGIGSATINTDSEEAFRLPGQDPNTLSAAAAAGFYAIAYDDPTYGTIISYRGTDDYNFLSELMTVDLPLSYPGSYQQEQIALAQRFLDAVNSSNGGSSILLTGHSLGGALGPDARAAPAS